MALRSGLGGAFAVLLIVLAAGSAHAADAPAPQGNVAEMTLFAFIYRPGPAWIEGKPMQEQALGPHVGFMQRLKDEGRLLVAGPLLETNGGIAVIRAADKQEADGLLASDPAVTSGIFLADAHTWHLAFGAGTPVGAAN
ncbi:MAG: hypothetical protein KF765_12750 [Parvibaculaceae bacterium]|nr:hypothetical protein [Parvibaculaceae bacterium]